MVGTTVTPIMGSSRAASRGSTSRTPGKGRGDVVGRRPQQGLQAGDAGRVPVRLWLAAVQTPEHVDHAQQGVVPHRRHRGVAGTALGGEPEAKHPLLPHAQRVEAAALVLDDLSGPLVHDHVAPHLLGHVLAQPLGADRRPRLLVARRDHEQLPRSRPPSGAGERARGGHLARDLSLHVQGAPPPHVAIAQLARPRVDAPFRGVCEHRVDVAQITEARPLRRTAQTGNEVRALVAHSQQLALEPGRLELTAQQLLGQPLVAGRVHRVEPDQPLEQRGRIVSEGHGRIMNDRHVDRPAARCYTLHRCLSI